MFCLDKSGEKSKSRGCVQSFWGDLSLETLSVNSLISPNVRTNPFLCLKRSWKSHISNFGQNTAFVSWNFFYHRELSVNTNSHPSFCCLPNVFEIFGISTNLPFRCGFCWLTGCNFSRKSLFMCKTYVNPIWHEVFMKLSYFWVYQNIC